MDDYITEKFTRAVAVLDKHFPGWHVEINLENFDMRFSSTCVLGQITGKYSLGRDMLKLREPDFKEYSELFQLETHSVLWEEFIRIVNEKHVPTELSPSARF